MAALELPVAAFLEAQDLVRRLDWQSRSAALRGERDYSIQPASPSFISEHGLDEGASELDLLESDRLAKEIGRRIAELVLCLVNRHP